MIEINVSPEEMKRAAQLATNVRLENVLLTGVQTINNLPRLAVESSVNLRVDVSHRYVGHKILANKAIFVEVGARVEFRIAQKDKASAVDKDPSAIVDVVYGVLYQLPSGPIPESINEEVFAAFARVNGLYNCWPYLRQEIQHLTGAMGTPFILPTLRIGTKPVKKEPEISIASGTLPALTASKSKESRSRKRSKT
jgi:hypothetical protein